jgi:putative endonuclease
MSYIVYVLRSKVTGVHYTGHTEDLDRRLFEHNNGLLGRFTKGKGPWEVIYTKEFETRAMAMAHEKYLKTGAGRDFIKKMEQPS